MNTILLQKILDILREGLAHVGDFFKDLVVSNPQDGQVIGYDGESGEWKNMYIDDLSLDVTRVTDTADILTITDAAAGLPLKSLITYIDNESGIDSVSITKCGKNIWNNDSTVSGTYRSSLINFNLPAGTYTISALVTSSDTDASTSAILFGYEDGTTAGIYLSRNVRTSNTITFTKDVVSIRFFASTSGALSVDDTFSFADIQIEAGEDVTAYSAYSGNTYTVSLPSTVTSGYVNVITGEGMSGDTPFSVTPIVIKTTSGVNNIYDGPATVRAEYYTATAGDIKSLVSISEDITDQVTVNTDNFSSVTFKVVKNNNVISIYLQSATAISTGGRIFDNLPAPAANMNMFVNDASTGAAVGATLAVQGRLNITAEADQTVNALITYVAR